jgi:hypothetical protein
MLVAFSSASSQLGCPPDSVSHQDFLDSEPQQNRYENNAAELAVFVHAFRVVFSRAPHREMPPGCVSRESMAMMDSNYHAHARSETQNKRELQNNAFLELEPRAPKEFLHRSPRQIENFG